MFCKWCGSKIQLTDAQCPTCGRETPPVSDCGGLYNLKTSQISDKPRQTPPVVMKCPIVERLEGKYAKDRKAARRHHVLNLVCFAIIGALILTGLVILTFQSMRLSEMEEKLDALPELLVVQPEVLVQQETEPMLPVTEPVPSEPILAEQNVQIDLLIGDGEASICIDLDEYLDLVSTTCGQDENSLLSAIVELKNSGATAKLLISQDEVSVSILSEIDDAAFGKETETVYEWQYRIGSNPEWLDLDEDIFSVEEDGMVTYDSDKLRQLVDQEGDEAELRCQISRYNENGGVLCISAEGISLGINFNNNSEN